MKNILLFLLISFSFGSLSAQFEDPDFSSSFVEEIRGGCSSVSIDLRPTNYTIARNFNADGVCAVSSSWYYPAFPNVTLFKLESNGSWSLITGPLIPNREDYTFTNLSDGEYRVEYFRADLVTNSQCDAIAIFDKFRGDFEGYRATIDVVNNPPIITGSVLVGNTTQSDISIFTRRENGTAERSSFTENDQIVVDLSQSEDFNRYRIDISQEGGSSNYRTTGWLDGTITEQNLNDIWNQEGASNWRFWDNQVFKVRVFLDNTDCRNGIWLKEEKVFRTCPSGINCRFTQSVANEILVLPNPTSDRFTLKELYVNEAGRYHLNLLDVNGRRVKSLALLNNEVDVSDMIPGFYVVQVLDSGAQLFTSKLVIK